MVAVLAAIAVTAVVVGIIAVGVTRAATNRRLNEAIGGREGADPIDEHHRLIEEAHHAATVATERVEVLELSLDSLTSGVVVVDETGTELVRNALASSGSARIHEKALVDAALAELLDLALRGDVAERELEVSGPPRRTLFLNAVPITTDGSQVGALAVIDDVTDHHRIDKTRRDFIANLSHELRTPVGAASLLGEMLVGEEDAEVRNQLTDRLLVETDRMSATIDDLLELSRIESAEQTYDDVVEMRQVVDEALARTRVAAETKSIDVGSVLPPEPVVILGNHDQLVTALVNLVENAIKYSSTGDSISVRTRVVEEGIQLIVQDTGRGIPARDLDRIFERFYRVDRSRDSATGGTGIGLSIVRHVALNHGGAVEVTSFEGDGSTFTMSLPRLAPAADADTIHRHKVQ